MAEPTSIGAAISKGADAVLATMGVDSASLIWGFIGALAAIYLQTKKPSVLRLMSYIGISIPIAALTGLAAAEGLNIASTKIMHFLCLLAGVGWQAIISACIEIAVFKIRGERGATTTDSGESK